ncbi:MAG: beta-ketoacyl-ACP synthase II, partial [Planctomycetota bacterium]|nr:beta-ketoacyl-ACP synthase II [Planctomycetota bacterium]
WKNLLAGKSGVARITRFDVTGWDVQIGAEVKGFDPLKWLDAREAKRLDRFVQFGIGAAAQAIEDARLDPAKEDRSRLGVIIGSGIGGLEELDIQERRLLEKGHSRVSPFFIPKMMMNALCGEIAMKFGFQGPNFGVASACASANHAVCTAVHMLRAGLADVFISGGSEAALTPSGLAGFQSLKALSTRNDAPERASRPFDKGRDGFILGEGAGVIVLETMEHALERGATIHAELAGVGMSADAYHITAPDPAGVGAVASMRNALKDAGMKPEDIQYINAHGTSTQLNDAVESRATKTVFGEHAKKLVISSTKSMIGHTLGAAGGIEIVPTVLSLKLDIVHPTANYEVPDPECDLDYVPNEPRRMVVTGAISNSFGFGGHNATIAVKKFRQ